MSVLWWNYDSTGGQLREGLRAHLEHLLLGVWSLSLLDIRLRLWGSRDLGIGSELRVLELLQHLNEGGSLFFEVEWNLGLAVKLRDVRHILVEYEGRLNQRGLSDALGVQFL